MRVWRSGEGKAGQGAKGVEAELFHGGCPVGGANRFVDAAEALADFVIAGAALCAIAVGIASCRNVAADGRSQNGLGVVTFDFEQRV